MIRGKSIRPTGNIDLKTTKNVEWVARLGKQTHGTPVVTEGRVYLVTKRCEVMCLDLAGMANGNDGPYKDEGRHMVAAGQPPPEPGPKDADILWICDMAAKLGARPHNCANCSVLVATWRHLYAIQGNAKRP